MERAARLIEKLLAFRYVLRQSFSSMFVFGTSTLLKFPNWNVINYYRIAAQLNKVSIL